MATTPVRNPPLPLPSVDGFDSPDPTSSAFSSSCCADSGKFAENVAFAQLNTCKGEDSLDACPPSSLYSVFDGHGSNEVSTFLSGTLHGRITSLLSTSSSSPPPSLSSALQTAYEEVNDSLPKTFKNVGSTSTTVLLDSTSSNIITANVGDSRAIAGSTDGTVTRLTVDHTPADPSELSRVTAKNVEFGRLDGALSVTRSFGDFSFTRYGLVATPSVSIHPLRDVRYVLCASDGLWDVYTDEECHEVVAKQMNEKVGIERIAKTMCEAAKAKGSDDDITVIIIKLI